MLDIGRMDLLSHTTAPGPGCLLFTELPPLFYRIAGLRSASIRQHETGEFTQLQALGASSFLSFLYLLMGYSKKLKPVQASMASTQEVVPSSSPHMPLNSTTVLSADPVNKAP